MKTSSRTDRLSGVTVLCSAALALAACSGARGPTLAEWRPIEPARAAREPLPDDAELIAARLAAAALAGQWTEARAANAALLSVDAQREARGELPS